MKRYDELKISLKKWETAFKEENQRKPGKTDIDNAPKEIHDAYKEYTDLKKSISDGQSHSAKTETQQQTSEVDSSTSRRKSCELSENRANAQTDRDEDIETEDGDEVESEQFDVWGKEFDHKMDTPETVQASKEKEVKKSSSYLQKLGSKMFDRATTLTSRQSSSDKAQTNKTFSRSTVFKPLENRDATELDGPNNKEISENNCDSLMPKEDVFNEGESDSFDIPPDRGNNKNEPEEVKFGGMFQKAMLMNKRKSEKSSVGDSGVFVGKFQTKSRSKQAFLPQSLSRLVEKNRNKYADDMSDLADDKGDTVDGDIPSLSQFISEGISSRSMFSRKELYDSNEMDGIDSHYSNTSVLSSEPELKNIKWPKKIVTPWETDTGFSSDKDTDSEKTEDVIIKSGKRKRVSQCSQVKKADGSSSMADDTSVNGMEEVQTSESSDQEQDEDVKPTGRKRKATGKTAETKRRKANDGSVQNDTGEETQPQVVKRAPPRDKPLNNNNFVRLNMKVKSYRRKGGGMTGAQHKRKLWKQKMSARSKSHGDSCFKCGQSGHWANKCPGNTNKKAWDKEPITEDDFPSMQQAAMMARGLKVPESSKKQVPVVKKPTKPTSSADSGDTVSKGASVGDTDPVAMETNDVTMEEDEELDVQADIVRSRHEDAPAPPSMEPMYTAQQDGSIPATPAEVFQGLKKFGFDSFRPGQEEAVMRILCGLSTLVVLSTGGGKSLCYQLAAYLYLQRSTCFTLVVSPLVSLMEDQVTGLPVGIRGVCLHTNMSASQKEGVIAAVKDGKAQFLLVSPEAVAGGSMSLLSIMASLPPISFACIDEAHCLSEWSHNFRPSYLRLCKVLQEKFGVSCFLGLTATATLSTAADVSRHLKITDFEQATIRGSPVPGNLHLSVSRDDNRDEAIIGILKGDRFSACKSIIIYCTRRDQTARVATLIRTCLNTGPPVLQDKKTRKKGLKLEWDAESYHAGLSAAKRKSVQNSFMSGRLRVVCATVAFGMGLDKSDVRGIIHYNMPKSFESYVQEIGRAGRDGEIAQCHVFLDPEGKDLCELRRHTFANTVDYRTLKRLIQLIFQPCRCRDVHQRHAEALQATREEGWSDPEDEEKMILKEGERICPGHERALPIEDTVMRLDVKEEGISTLLCYLELHSNNWLENLSSVYANCKIQCYGGPAQLQAVAKKCPPVAVAIAKGRKEGKSFGNSNSIEFSVVDISDTMGWNSGPVKKEIKLLQWSFNSFSGAASRSGIMVEFTDLAFHFRSPGDLAIEEMDDMLQFLHERVQKQEKTELRQLNRLCKTLKGVSHRHHWMCADELDMARNDRLKAILNDYFEHQTADKNIANEEEEEEEVPTFNKDQVVCDVRHFFNLYSQEHSFNGRAIARIFHGIASPCYPAITWGRVRRFWRSHLDVDFNELMKLATTELIKIR